MEALFSEFAFLSDQALRDKNFDPSTIEDLMKLFELDAYKAWASQELDQQSELAQSESYIKESEERLDSAMEEAMAEFHRFEEEMDSLCRSEYTSLINVAECARKLGKNLEKAADFAATKYVEAAVGSAVASMKSAAKAISNNCDRLILFASLSGGFRMGRDRDISRSPLHRRRYSPSPSPVRFGRRTRRDRSRSPYSRSRKRSRSLSHEHHRSRSRSQKRHKSRSPTPKRNERQRKKRTSVSSLNVSPSVISGSLSKETKDASEKLREEEEKKRRQQEAELKLIEEETEKRVAETIQKKVEERLSSVELNLEIEQLLKEGRKKLVSEVAAQLEKEKESALAEAHRKEEQARREKEELARLLEENRRKVEEYQRREALEQQIREEERYEELVELQRQKEEALRRKKQQEEEERANQMKLLGKNKSRPKVSFALGLK